MTYDNPGDPDRTQDSVDQLEDSDLRNPITEDAELTEVAEGFEPATDRSGDDHAEGPAPRTQQMPR
jgi:hypothetical protein